MSAKDSAENREEAVDSIIKFLDTDTILYQQSYPERLVRLQNQHWLPPVNWANSRYGLGIRPTEGLMLNTSTVTDNDRQKLRHEVLKFDGMKLAGFERAVIASKSFLIGLALVEGKLGVEQAVEAARVELMAQTAVWGNVEDVHDLELQFTRRQLSSSMLFLLDGRESDEGQ
jgi:ATP synthase F1 complex assembly factor 2